MVRFIIIYGSNKEGKTFFGISFLSYAFQNLNALKQGKEPNEIMQGKKERLNYPQE